MSNRPLDDFIKRGSVFNSTDLAVLVSLIACQEVAADCDFVDLISPHVETRIWNLGDLGPEQLSASIKRLEEAGEIQFYKDEHVKGYQVRRFDEFQDLFTQFGMRRYNRLKQQSRRDKAKDVA
jgi:hypothetical protein